MMCKYSMKLMYKAVPPKNAISIISLFWLLYTLLSDQGNLWLLQKYEVKCVSYFTRRSLVLQPYNLRYRDCVFFYSFK